MICLENGLLNMLNIHCGIVNDCQDGGKGGGKQWDAAKREGDKGVRRVRLGKINATLIQSEL